MAIPRDQRGFVIQGSTDGPSEYTIKVQSPDRGIHVVAYMPENFTSSIASDYDVPFAEGFVRNLPHGEKIHLGMRLAGFGTTTQIMSMQVWQGTAPMDFSIPVQFLLNTSVEQDIIAPIRNLMALTLPRLSDLQIAVGNQSNQGQNLTQGLLISPGPKITFQGGNLDTPDYPDRIQRGLRDVTVNTIVEGIAGVQDTTGALFRENVDIGGIGRRLAQQGTLLFSFIELRENISLQIGNFLYFPSVVITNVDSDYEIKLDEVTRKPIALNATVGFRTFLTPTADDLAQILPEQQVLQSGSRSGQPV